jgi:membrane-associated protease RseP (regulator of RpoE activity)
LELWKLNTAFKLFLLSISTAFLTSAILHYTLILRYLPVALAIGVGVYVSLIINPTLRTRRFRTYVAGTVFISTVLAVSIVALGYYSLITIESCPQAGPVPLDWTGTVILDVERHPYLDSGVTVQFSFDLLSGPGYRVRITQDPFTTPVLHTATLGPSANSDVWNFSPSTCGKYWIELLNIGFGSQSSEYHVTVVAVRN